MNPNATAAEIEQGQTVTINYAQRYLSHVVVTRTREFEANGARWVMVNYRVSHVGQGNIVLPARVRVEIVGRQS